MLKRSAKFMINIPKQWRPLGLADLQDELAISNHWILCGGHSVAVAVGRDARTHGDIDVGVFRTHVREFLRMIGPSRVFLCRRGAHEKWDGSDVPSEVHDIWITSRDGEFWAFQIMVFDDEGDEVIYRRDSRIRWPKSSHSYLTDGVEILNPLVTLLFKVHHREPEEKDVHDVIELIKNWPNKAHAPNPQSLRAPSGG